MARSGSVVQLAGEQHHNAGASEPDTHHPTFLSIPFATAPKAARRSEVGASCRLNVLPPERIVLVEPDSPPKSGPVCPHGYGRTNRSAGGLRRIPTSQAEQATSALAEATCSAS